MQIPILNGIYTDNNSDFRTSYPRNYIPVPKSQGVSSGYLRPAEGIVEFSDGPGLDRGGINWNDECYRAMGTKLVKIDSAGAVSVLGDVGGSTQISIDYSFDRLAIASNQNLFYWDGATLTQVTDPDLGVVIDMIWVDGFFMTTDGEFLVVTELSDPLTVFPFKYGSSEADPDPIKALIKLRNEPHALNRYTIEVFQNTGGAEFPFLRVESAQITKGTVGTHTCAEFIEAIAFVGGGRKGSISVWLGANGNTRKIATREIDQILSEYTETVLSTCLVESRTDKNHEFLYIHLPDKTLVYDDSGSRAVGQPVWFILTSGVSESQYLAQNLVWCYDRWLVGHPTQAKTGYLANNIASHWGEIVTWEFSTSIVYNDGNGAIFNEIELVSLTGRADLGDDPQIGTRFSLDGETWSQYQFIKAGKIGERNKRLSWFKQGMMQHWRIQQFYGDSKSMLSFARLEAQVEALYQ